jgi:DNA-binding response OmpR family regulator
MILLVERETDEQDGLGLAPVLRSHGYDLHEAGSIADALEVIIQVGDKLDLAILDYLLPPGRPTVARSREIVEKLHGDSTAEIIADFLYRNRIGAAVLYITSGASSSMRHVVLGTRAEGYLLRPYRANEAVAEVDRIYRRHRRRCGFEADPSDSLCCITTRSSSFRLGLFQVVMHLAGPQADNDGMKKVLRTVLDGTSGDAAYRECSMSRATYTRTKAALRTLLNIDNFTGDLTRRIDEALARGEIKPTDLLGVTASLSETKDRRVDPELSCPARDGERV